MGSVPSLKSVAAAAGVSVSSVSNAYNKPEQLSAEVRARILAVAKDQGYAGPDAAARSLRSKRAGAIGIMLTERLSYAFSDPFSVGLLAGIADVAEKYRSGMVLIPLAPPDGDHADDVAASVEAVRQAVVDGVIAYCIDPQHPARDVIRSRGLTIVSTIEEVREGKHVLIDEVAAGRNVGELIRTLGHRRVGVVAYADNPIGTTEVLDTADESRIYEEIRQRLQGFRAGLGDGVEMTVVSAGYNDIESGRAAAATLLDRADRPTALLAMSDIAALGALTALEQRRLVPGRDISVTGFDDIPQAEPAGLTTVRQPIRERGRLLARMLLDPTYAETEVVLPTELVVRASTGPVPKGATP
jgi:DNA-binding LacI/PurR family transcriptional regulator